MAISDVSLTSAMRANLVSLQGTVSLLSRTQERLSTGKKVNSALDNPVNFFTAQAHLSRANDLSNLKDAMSEAVQNLQAANTAITSLTSLISQAKALGQAALGANKNEIKIQFSSMTHGDTIDIGGVTYNAQTGSSVAGFDPTTDFVVTSDATTTVANLARLINANDELADGGTADMKATASGNILTLSAKASDVAITQGDYKDYADIAGITTGIATVLTNIDGSNVFSDRKALGEQYNQIMAQIDAIANSAQYNGVNLLGKDDLNVKFENSALNVKGFSASASDLGLNTVASTNVLGAGGTASSGTGWGWSLDIEITADIGKLDQATSTLRSQASSLSNNLSLIKIQQDFSINMVSTLQTGADNLTLADTNEEGANMLMLQTRQSLGTTSLSLASQAAQSVLRLFG
jgi:flagellin